MKINRDELLKVLSTAKPALAKKEFIEQAVHFIFTGSAIATFNDRLCIIAPFNTEVAFSVKGEEFYKALESINEPEVEIILEENQVKIVAERTQAGLSTLVGENERVEGTIANLQERTKAKKFWKRLPSDFVKGVSLCMFSASKDMTKGVVSCVAVLNNLIQSADSARVCRFTMEKSIPDELMIPARDAMELVKYNVTHYGTSNEWIHFLTEDGILFNCKTMSGSYPYQTIEEKIFSDNVLYCNPRTYMTLPPELQDALKVASVFAEGDVDVSKTADITIEKGKLTCKSRKERGWMTKVINLPDYKGKKINFYINPVFFAQILNSSTTLFVIQGELEPDKAVFTTDTFQHVIALPEEKGK